VINESKRKEARQSSDKADQNDALGAVAVRSSASYEPDGGGDSEREEKQTGAEGVPAEGCMYVEGQDCAEGCYDARDKSVSFRIGGAIEERQ